VTRNSLVTARVSNLTPKISHPKQAHNPSTLGLLFYNQIAVMQFTKQAILDADIDILSPGEKTYLLNKYFPGTLPEWKAKLRSSWKEVQKDRLWRAYQGDYTYGDFGDEYRYAIKHLKFLAERIGKTEPPSRSKGVRVTDFTKWVMSLYLGQPKPSSLARGKHIERSVARLAKPSDHSKWELIYRDPLECAPTPLKISSLTFNGESLWGAPDLVYRNTDNGELLIVERKASDKPIPADGWPNLRAQLWSYSHIDDFKDAPAITLIGEIWDLVDGQLTRRAVLRWSQADKEFDAENMELFSLYGGVRHPRHK
jgi:hypothetical protein